MRHASSPRTHFYLSIVSTRTLFSLLRAIPSVRATNLMKIYFVPSNLLSLINSTTSVTNKLKISNHVRHATINITRRRRRPATRVTNDMLSTTRLIIISSITHRPSSRRLASTHQRSILQSSPKVQANSSSNMKQLTLHPNKRPSATKGVTTPIFHIRMFRVTHHRLMSNVNHNTS